MADLRMDTDEMRQTASSVRRIRDDLGSMNQTTDALSGAVGHPRLASACESFTKGWRIHREELITMTQGLADAIDAAAKAMEDADRCMAGGGGSAQPSQPAQPAAGGQPASGGSTAGSGGEALAPAAQPAQGEGLGVAPGMAPGLGGAGVGTVGGGAAAPALGDTLTAAPASAAVVDADGADAQLEDAAAFTVSGTAVNGGAAQAELEDSAVFGFTAQTVTDEAGEAGLAQADALESAGVSVVGDEGADAGLEAAGVEAPFVVGGVRQQVIGYVDGLGTLLGTPGEAGQPPVVTAVLDEQGTVVDIADLQAVVDDEGRLVSVNQVAVDAPVRADLQSPQMPGDGGVEAGTVAGVDAAAQAVLEDPEVQAQVDEVRQLLGAGEEVALTGVDEEGNPTLTIAGVAGIGLAALVALGQVVSRSGGAMAGASAAQPSLEQLLDALDRPEHEGVPGSGANAAEQAGASEQSTSSSARSSLDTLMAALVERSAPEGGAGAGAGAGAVGGDDSLLPEPGGRVAAQPDAGLGAGAAGGEPAAPEPGPGEGHAAQRAAVGGLGMAAGLGAMGGGGTISAAEERRRGQARQDSERKDGVA